MGRPNRSSSSATLPHTSDADAGRRKFNNSLSRTRTNTLTKLSIPRNKSRLSTPINSPTSESADDEIFYDAPDHFGGVEPPSSALNIIESGRVPPMQSFGTAANKLLALTPCKPTPRPQKKALLIGLNYQQCGKGLRLRHATEDARRFATTLSKFGYSSKVVTDDQGQSFASCEYLLECMDSLVRDASAGDRLFFLFSGHCLPPNDCKEPRLVAADMMAIPRSTFQDRLVSRVPAGAELTIVLDCCHAAGMVKLKYRVGQMVPEIKPTGGSEVQSESKGQAASPLASVPHHKSLNGLRNVDTQAPTSPPLATPTTTHQFTFNHSFNTTSHRRHPIAAAPPLTSSNQVPVSSPVIPLAGSLPSTAATQTNPARRRQSVIQGRPVPQFQERKDDFVAPAGKVTFWAGTGERLKAFEAFGDVKSGIVSGAFCSALDKCQESTVTRRDLWKSLIEAVGNENSWRRERDVKKPNFRNIPINTRLQLAELWVSQHEALSSCSPALNQVVECPWKS